MAKLCVVNKLCFKTSFYGNQYSFSRKKNCKKYFRLLLLYFWNSINIENIYSMCSTMKQFYAWAVYCIFTPTTFLFLPPIFLSIFIGFARLQYNLASVQKRQKTGIKIFGSFICSRKNSHLEFKLDFMLIILLYIFISIVWKKG